MAKDIYFPWDRIPSKVYRADLTSRDRRLMEGCVRTIIKNIFRREKDPVKRAVLVSQVSSMADSMANNITAKEDVKWKMKHLVKKTKNKKKKNKRK